MNTAWLLWLGVWLGIEGGIQFSNADSRLEARIVDDATGARLAARVAITNCHGRFVEIAGDHPHLEYLGPRWYNVRGVLHWLDTQPRFFTESDRVNARKAAEEALQFCQPL